MAEAESLLTSPAFVEILRALGLNTVDADAFQMLEDARQQVQFGEMSMDEYEALKTSVELQLKNAALQLALAAHGGATPPPQQAPSGRTFGSYVGLQKKEKVEAPEDEKPILESELLKAPITQQFAFIGQKKFQTRYVVLYKSCIVYYNSKEAKDAHNPKGRIDLSPDFFIQDSNAHLHGFVISDMNINLTLAAETEELKGYWMHMVATVIRKLKEKASDGTNPVTLTHAPEDYQGIYNQRLEEFKKSKANRRKSMFFRKKKEHEEELKKKAGEMAVKQTYEEMKEIEKKRQQELEELQHKLHDATEDAEKYKLEAQEEAARAEREAARAEAERIRAEEAEARAGMSMEEWQAEARARELELEQERDKIMKLLEQSNIKRRQSMMPGSSMNMAEIERLEKERKALQAKLDALSKALDLDMGSLEWDGTLEDAEAKMKELVPKLCSEDEKEAREAQVTFDQWDKIIRNHADYKKREEEKWKTWEANEKEPMEKALATMKSIVPFEVTTGVDKDFLMKRGLTPQVADRIMKTKIFLFYYTDKETIAKTHIADLSSRYVIQGLDIVELRAVWLCLPAEFALDGDGKKALWKETFRAKLHQMTQKEKDGTISKNDARNAAYRPPEAKPAGGGPLGGGGGSGGGAGRGANPMAGALAGLFAGRGGPPGAGRAGPPIAANALQNALAAKLAGGPGGGGLPPKAVVMSQEAQEKEEKKKDAGFLLGILQKGKSEAAAAANHATSNDEVDKEPAPQRRPSLMERMKNTVTGGGSSKTLSPPPATSPEPEVVPKPEEIISSRPAAGSVSGNGRPAAGSVSGNGRPAAGSVSGNNRPAAGSVSGSSSAPKSAMALRFEEAQKAKASEESQKKKPLDLGFTFNAPAPAKARESVSLLSKDAQNLLDKMRQGAGGGTFEGEVKTYDFLGAQEERNKKTTFVDDGINKVSEVIKKFGKKDAKEGGVATIKFGELYKSYGEGSDMLVGILMRGKKQKKIKYAGDMLFKDVHDNVNITLL